MDIIDTWALIHYYHDFSRNSSLHDYGVFWLIMVSHLFDIICISHIRDL